MLSLTRLANGISGAVGFDAAHKAVEIHGLTCDSRTLQPGMAFVAIRGEKFDGNAFIEQAAKQGARIIVVAEDTLVPALPDDVAVLRVHNPRRALAEMAAMLYGPQPEHVVAVTGTDGKTSTAEFFRQLMVATGHKAASLGTLGILGSDGREVAPALHTTPDPVALHQTLQSLNQGEYGYASIEASSHGLDQYRLHGVRVQAAAFTYLGRDHLDYHKTVAAYFAAKLKLFSEVLKEEGVAVLNQDDPHFIEIESICRSRHQRVIGYGKQGHHLKIVSQKPTQQGQHLELSLMGHAHSIDLPLVGDFQAMNMLAAAGLCMGCGVHIEELVPHFVQLAGIPGRLECAAVLENGAAIYVDYAHTPAALAKVLHVLRAHTSGKLHVLFGCGGDRDKGKRPEMGKIAKDLADVVTVTDDNPRTEDPATIRAEIMQACAGAKEVADRKLAIYGAAQALGAGDILVLAGKGHEKTQIVGERTLPFDDVAIAREAAGTIAHT